MYYLILADIQKKEPTKSRTVATVCLSDEIEKIEVVLKMLSGLLRHVPEEQMCRITDSFIDLTTHYLEHVKSEAVGEGRRSDQKPAADEARMRFMLEAVGRFVENAPEDFIHWLRVEARKPMLRGLRIVR